MSPKEKQSISEVMQFVEHWLLTIVKQALGHATKHDVFVARVAVIDAFERTEPRE